jgi:hypothetical protein
MKQLTELIRHLFGIFFQILERDLSEARPDPQLLILTCQHNFQGTAAIDQVE